MTVIECRANTHMSTSRYEAASAFSFYYYEQLVNFNQLVNTELIEYLSTDSSEQVF